MTDPDLAAPDLAARGAAALEALSQACAARYESGEPFTHWVAPGRVNLLGDHTDYNGGYVLPMTIDRGVYQALRRRDDGRVRLHCVNLDESIDYPNGEAPALEPGSWGSYVVGATEELRALTGFAGGFELAFYGDVPPGAGLSSSAALTVSTALALDHLFATEVPKQRLAQLCQDVERLYAGVHCGIMDQYAAALGRAGFALFLDCRDLVHRDVPIDLVGCKVVIVHSGVRRGLSSSAYNERRQQCENGVSLLQERHPDVVSLRDVTPAILQRDGTALDAITLRRCRHVVDENERVQQGVAALEEGDMARFGALMNQSHDSLAGLYEVSCPELDVLVEIARGVEGVWGARMTGAGFGGCIVVLAMPAAVQEMTTRIQVDYPGITGCTPEIFVLSNNMQAGTLHS